MSRLVDDNMAFTTVGRGKCNLCSHIASDGLTCEAFPASIPIEILVGEFDHARAFEGDNGIRFKRRPQRRGERKANGRRDSSDSQIV